MDFDTDAFVDALLSAFDMDQDDAQQICSIVSECFFGENEVNDEDLDKETRSLFYTLEAEGLMTFRRTEYRFEGAIRRAFFWRLTEAVTARQLEGPVGRVELSEEEQVNKLYQTLHEDAWNRDAISA